MNILILYSLSKTKRTFLPALDIVMLPQIANICDQKEYSVYHVLCTYIGILLFVKKGKLIRKMKNAIP